VDVSRGVAAASRTRPREQRTGQQWAGDRELFSSYPSLAEVLASVLPDRYPSIDAAKETLRFAQSSLDTRTNDGAVDRLVRWVEHRTQGQSSRR
jgi:hypothetical protein